MHFTLICLYDQGRRLTNEELLSVERFTGNPIIEDTWRDSGLGRRYFRIAKLFSDGPEVNRHELLPPLMDPVVTMDDGRMMLTGYQIHPGDTPIHYAQQWALRAI